MGLAMKNIEKIISRKGLKKKAVAEKIGVSSQKICDLIAGRATLKADMIPLFCYALEVEPNDIYDEREEERHDDPGNHGEQGRHADGL